MYKFIIGNVRISVTDNSISRLQAIESARQTISSHAAQNRLLSHIELSRIGEEIEINITERSGNKMLRKSLRQSILGSLYSAVHERLSPDEPTISSNAWYDSETGQEWHGQEVASTQEEILAEFDSWVQQL